MRIKIIFLIFTIASHMLFSQQKTAIIISANSIQEIVDDDEKKAAEWFVNTSAEMGDIIPVGNILEGSIDLSLYTTIWIHIDREDGTVDLYEDFKKSEFLTALKTYYQNGGNLLLTTHATRLLYLLDRVSLEPNVVNGGESQFVNETWTVNPTIKGICNYEAHPIYSGLATSRQYPHKTFRLISSGQKEDHNCLWDVDMLGLEGDPLTSFEKQTNSRVIGTWGQNIENPIAGIVEFLPNPAFKGKCITIGIGAYEWNVNDGTNIYQTSIENITSNSLEYLTTEFSNNELPVLTSYYDFELDASKTSITEQISGLPYLVNHSKATRENVPGVKGNALRLDGFSGFVNASINSEFLYEKSTSISLWAALDAYPMMNIDGADNSYTWLAGNLSDSKGFAYLINCHGNYGFECYIGGTRYQALANDKLQKYEWVNLTVYIDKSLQEIVLKNNGQIVAKKYFSTGIIDMGSSNFVMGKDFNDIMLSSFRLNTISGLIDELEIWSGYKDFDYNPSIIENVADLSVPEIRFENEIHRPVFHGMPEANWTNETHGLIYYNDKYHLFFQKNGSGPYWGRIHWGHLVSDDMINWIEQKTSIDPLDSYDIKGAWSGCVFTDSILTGNQPYIYYSAADLGKVSISQASPMDVDLVNWSKNTMNPLIGGRPAGLDEDFRDPYIFKSNGDIYMIVGAKVAGKGAATLHKRDQISGSWSNDGKLFYQALSSDYGTFWEMPFVVEIESGKFMFGVTQLGGIAGVETLYWIGTINSDGTFKPFSHIPKEMELGEMSKFGYGMLSPSVMQKDGKTIALGIVPDKLSSESNYNMGWAHLYSFPREWSLDENNNLLQKPHAGLRSLRSNTAHFEMFSQNIADQTISLSPVSGASFEINATFTIDNLSNQIGFNLRKSGTNLIKLYYEKATNQIVVDASRSRRLINDAGSFDGIYKTVLPEKIEEGGKVNINVFMDHSIMDIFINEKWAFSIRLFPYRLDANQIELFSVGQVGIDELNAWNLVKDQVLGLYDTHPKKEFNIWYDGENIRFTGILSDDFILQVFDMMGRKQNDIRNHSDLSKIELKKGMIYMVYLEMDNKVYSQKLVV